VGDKKVWLSHKGFPPALETPSVGPSPLSSSASFGCLGGHPHSGHAPEGRGMQAFAQTDPPLTTQWDFGFESQSFSYHGTVLDMLHFLSFTSL
jgi:hypothetical protein